MASKFRQQLDALWKIHDKVLRLEDLVKADELADDVFKVIEGVEKIASELRTVRRTIESITEYGE